MVQPIFRYLCMSLCLCVQASVAKLETSVSYVGDKLELKVYGFNQKLPVLLSKVLSAARTFMPTDDRYKVIGMFVWLFLMLMLTLFSFLPCSIFSVFFLCCHGPLLI